MSRVVLVDEVSEYHDLCGFKHIDVISRGHDELFPTTYSLTSRFMIPYEKLLLTTVSPGDEILTEIGPPSAFENLTSGEYVGNLFNAQERDIICRCGYPINSDGDKIWCENRSCPLTILARIKNLATTRFFNVPQWSYHESSPFDGYWLDSPVIENPFGIILDPKFWGKNGWSLEKILLDKACQHVSTATFLVQDQLRSFMDSNNSSFYENSTEFNSVVQFFNMMDQIVFRREYESHIQNCFIKEFIMSLSIPGLDVDIVSDMVIAEIGTGMMDDVFLPYVNYLSNPLAMQEDLHVDRIHADYISREFYLRRHEFFDIFSTYSTSRDIIDIFNNINRSMRNLKETFKMIQ